MFWLPVVAIAIEPGHTEVLVERLTEEMHWFGATAIDVERIRCTIGIPTDGTGDPYVGCAFPAGRIADPEVPGDLRRAAREARRQVHDQSDRRVTDVRVTYIATERRAWLCDHALLPNALWTSGNVVVGIRGEEAHLALGADASGGGEGIRGCVGRPLAHEVPDAVQGTSVLSRAVFGADDVAAKAALDDLLRRLPGLAADLPPTPGPVRDGTAPIYLVSDAAGRPVPGGAEGWLRVPDDPARVVGSRVTWWLVAADGTMSPAGATLVSGLPDADAGLVGPPLPPGSGVKAILEVFASDEPVSSEWTPEANGFQRLATWTLIFRP